MPIVNREEFLQSLEAVKHGLSVREILEQSSCFVFENGQVMTFNDEVACRSESGLGKEFKGAVNSKPLLNILAKLPEETVEVQAGDGELIIIGKKRRAGIRMEAEVTLPISAVETPGKWTKLHEDFAEAVGIVMQCASKDESKFEFTCIHLHPKWLEACDDYQLARYKLPTGFPKALLVRAASVKAVISLSMEEWSETENWLHFRNAGGLILSCRKYVHDYVEITGIIKAARETGESTVLPKGLGDAVDKAKVFTEEMKDDPKVIVELKPGLLRLTGTGTSGWYKESKKVNYSGAPISFLISPDLLAEVTKKYNECFISADKLRIEGGKFVYIACLSAADNGEKESEE